MSKDVILLTDDLRNKKDCIFSKNKLYLSCRALGNDMPTFWSRH